MANNSEPTSHAWTAPGPPPANILLVDDNRANLLVLRVILEGLGHNLLEAYSGEEALQLLKQHEFAVVLLDVQMPGMNGFETAQRIRSQEQSRHTPLIFLTACESDEFPIEGAYSLGAVDYLVKPFSPVILQAKLAGFVELYQEKKRAQREADQLRLLVQGTTEYAIFLLDPEGRVSSWNPGAERIKQYRFDEIVGQHFSRFYPQEAVDRGWPQYELQVAKSEGRFENEGWRVRKDGTQFWANVVITALYDEAGCLRGFSKITRDMTERKLAEENARRLLQEEAARRAAEENAQIIQEQRERLHVTLASIGDAVISTDADGRVTFLNPVAERLIGWTQDEVRGKPLLDVFHIVHEETRQPVENPVFRSLGAGDIVGLAEETVLIAKDGVERPIDDSAAPMRNAAGEIIGAVLVFRDITERKKAENALREADRRKDEFLATLAHELRNPLAPIRNSLQILKMPRVDAAMAQHTREIMERQVQHVIRLVDDLLDVSRVMRGKIELRKEIVEMASVVAHAVETAQSLIEAQGHELTVTLPDEPLPMNVDPVRIAQVLGNLLTNAAKYTEPNGCICLLARRDGDQVELRVRDNGIGLAPDMLPHIFELFVQADHAATRSQGGLGIGLTLVKNLVEMHHGTVEAHSEGLGKGCEFVVRLPLAAQMPASKDRNQDPPPQTASRSGNRLMVVDDNKDAANTLAIVLRLQGHEVCVAHDGPSALELIQTFTPEMIFLDIGMPGMDGYDVARRVRQQPGLKNVALAALTGWGQQEDRRRSAEAGFDHHLVKPLEPKVLDGILAELKQRTS